MRRKSKNQIDVLKTGDSKRKTNKQNIFKQCSNNKTLIGKRNSSKNKFDLKIRSKPKTNGHSLEIASLKTSSEELNKAKPVRKNLKSNSKNNIQKQVCKNNPKIKTKQNDKPCFKKLSLNSKFAMETESVKRRCELLAQKTEQFIKNNKRNPEAFINENCHYTRSNIITSNKKIAIKTKVNEIVIHEYIPLPPKFNYDNLAKSNIKNKQFKSNYDLLQTIINSQQGSNKQWVNVHDCSMLDLAEPECSFMHKNEKTNSIPFKRVSTDLNRKLLVRELNNHASFHEEIPDYSRHFIRNESSLSVPRTHKNSMQVSESNSLNNSFHPDTLNISLEPDDGSLCRTAAINSNVRPCLMKASDDTSAFEVITFQSHNYPKQDFQTESNVELYNMYKQPRNFITTQSRENFSNYPENNRLKANKINLYKKHLNNNKRKLNKSMKMFDMENNTVKGIRESYTIECTQSHVLSSKNQTNVESMQAMIPSTTYIFKDLRETKDHKSWLTAKNNKENDNDFDYEPLNRNTCTINNLYRDENDETYTIQSTNNNENSNTKFVYTQENVGERQILNPIDVCETVLEHQELSTDGIREYDLSFSIQDPYDKLNENRNTNDIKNLPIQLSNTMNKDNPCNEKQLTKPQNQEELENISHHFTILKSNIFMSQSPILIHKHGTTSTVQHSQKTTTNNLYFNEQNKNAVADSDIPKENNDTGAFNIRNRLVFVPKGDVKIINKYT